MTAGPSRRGSSAASDEPPHRYDEWLAFHFGRIGDDTDPWCLDWVFPSVGAEMIVLFTRTMDRSGTDLAGYSDRQLSIGLEALLFSSFGQFAHALPLFAVDESAKVEAVRSLSRLYSDCLSPRAAPVLGHLSETAGSPLEYVTYMLWDCTPLTAFAASAQTRPELLRVLEDALYLPNPACVESALHGLGHLRTAGLGTAGRNGELEAMVDRYLASARGQRPELLDYARVARSGCVL